MMTVGTNVPTLVKMFKDNLGSIVREANALPTTVFNVTITSLSSTLELQVREVRRIGPWIKLQFKCKLKHFSL